VNTTTKAVLLHFQSVWILPIIGILGFISGLGSEMGISFSLWLCDDSVQSRLLLTDVRPIQNARHRNQKFISLIALSLGKVCGQTLFVLEAYSKTRACSLKATCRSQAGRQIYFTARSLTGK